MAESLSFDRVAQVYDETRGGLVRGRRMARDVAAHLTPGTTLEIGIGTGAVALGLTELGHQVVGVDVAPAMLSQAYQRLGPRVAIGDATALPVGDGTVANAVFVHVLHLVGDMSAAIAEAARVLRPGGRLVALHGTPQLASDELSTVTAPLERLRQQRVDTPAQVRQAAADAGLQYVHSGPSTPGVLTETPAALADKFEQRIFSWMWRIDDVTWQREVGPVAAALRAMPDPDRPRKQTHQVWVSVCEKPFTGNPRTL
ncbi:MAG: class I SAM-dependent methyltransferase [Micromonosporaceae bacterium]